MGPSFEPGRAAAAFVALFGLLGILLGSVAIAHSRTPTLSPTTTATTEPPSPYAGRVGVNGLDFFFPDRAPADLARLSGAGLFHLRENFWWDDLEPRPGRFDWEPADALMAEAARVGVEVLPILDYSAEWASSAPPGAADPIFHPPEDPADYARFAGAVVERYGPGGEFWSERPDLVPVPITAVEIWNEPWLDTFWLPRADPEEFAGLAVLAARAIEAENPEVEVLIDGSARRDVGDAPWIRQVLQARPELVELVDAYAVHPYTGMEELERTRAVTAALDAEKPLWVTEIGWSTATDADGNLLEHAVDEDTQADNLEAAVTTAFDEHGVERLYVYTDTCDEPGPATDSLEGYFGLCRADGTPKPAWDALLTLLYP
jgi:hypothetical protein